MNKKYIYKIIFMFLVIVAIFSIPKNVEASSSEFSGSRTTVMQIDKSDLELYISGGRSMFELVLRENASSWFEYNIESENNTVTFTFSFDFSTYDEYVERLTVLLTNEPVIISEDGGIVENFKSIDLINFIEYNLEVDEMIIDTKVKDLFSVSSSTLVLNGETYETQDAIDTRNSSKITQYRNIEISTVVESSSSISRTIILQVLNDDQEVRDAKISNLVKKFESVGDVSSEGDKITVILEAKSFNELIKQTMEVLQVSVQITRSQSYLQKDSVKTKFEEYIDIENLLEENGNLKYTITFPSDYTNLSKEDEDDETITINEEENSVCVENFENTITLNYEGKFEFSDFIIETDLSNESGKITRKIILVAPSNVAASYNDTIKESLSFLLVQGMTLNVYDMETFRYYSIEFSSLTLSRLKEKTSYILGTENTISFSNKRIGLMTSVFSEKIEYENFVEDMVIPSSVTLKYIVPTNSKNVATSLNSEEVQENVCSITVENGTEIELEFKYMNKTYSLIMLVIIIIIVILVIIIIRKLKKGLSKKMKKNK